MNRSCVLMGVALSLAGGLAFAQPKSGAAEYEQAPSVPVAKLLDASYLSGKTFRVMENADGDGMLFSFSMWTPFGWYRPNSLAMLYVRIVESLALAKLNEMKEDPLFLQGITDSAANTVKSTAQAVTQPLKTLRSVPMGLEKFGRGVQARTSEGTVAGESGRMRDLAAKRKIAVELGVDPYSDNPQLQDALNTVANHKNSGAIAAKLGTMAVGGGTGVAIRAAQLNKKLQAKLVDMSGAELQQANRKALVALGADPGSVDKFLRLQGYSVTRTTAITDALTDLAGVRNLSQYLSFARPATAPEIALFHEQQIEMAAKHHQTVGKLVSFAVVGGTGVFTDSRGEKHIFAPVDVVYWSPNLAQRVQSLKSDGKAGGQVHLWITGAATKMAGEKLEVAGVKLHENAGTR